MSFFLQTRADRAAETPWVFVGTVLFGVVIVLGVHLWLGKRRRPIVEEYLARHQPDMQLIGLRYPPANLWLRNRQFDSWFRVVSAAGDEQWCRVRSGQVELFE